MQELLLSSISVESLTEKIAFKLSELMKQQKTKETENKLYSVKSLADLSGVSELTVRNWITQGKIKAKRIGRRLFIEQSQFDKGLQEVKSLKYKR
jgi:excisionase family DNA binding protein